MAWAMESYWYMVMCCGDKGKRYEVAENCVSNLLFLYFMSVFFFSGCFLSLSFACSKESNQRKEQPFQCPCGLKWRGLPIAECFRQMVLHTIISFDSLSSHYSGRCLLRWYSV